MDCINPQTQPNNRIKKKYWDLIVHNFQKCNLIKQTNNEQQQQKVDSNL